MNQIDVFLNDISEKQFMEDYEKCKRIVDGGVRSYFILADNSMLQNVSQLENTTLMDIIEIFGEDVLEMLRIAEIPYCPSATTVGEGIHTLRIRRLKNKDRKNMRSSIRFFPKNSFVSEWVDGDGNGLLMPFVQKDNGDILFLAASPVYTITGKSLCVDDTYPYHRTKELIERIPDYLSSNFAVATYRGVDVVIPIKKGSAKKTFKNREKEDGVKKRLIHDVKPHARKNLRNTDVVEHHIRGTSSIFLNGIEIRLCATLDQAVTLLKRDKRR
ncbi:MAG: hypothetical protein IJZ56_03245 [Oscillospiraceae bacterium]|nr:hypothetical protein [Oscillospiraceae bacterium]